MNFSSRRIVVVAATTLAVVGGGAAAVAATGGGSRTSDFLDSVAKHLGVSPQKLEDATKAAAVDQVNADLAAGRITKEQADELKKRIEAGDGVLGGPGRLGYGFGGPGGGPGSPGFPGPGLVRPAIANELAAAAKYLGLSESDLRTKLRDGQSLADVAKAQSKDLDGLKTAILAAAKADLDKAVADKKLTQSQADDIYDGLKSHIDDIVNADVKLRHFRGPGGPGPALGFGFGADTAAAAKYLGLSESALRDKLRDGQSLADVAKAQSKDVQGLEDAIVASQKARLDKAVSDKKLTQSQADDILAKLKSHVDDLVNAKPGDRPDRGERRGGGPRFFFGP
jgi:DNA polymerase III epsilon subunit-like protein